MRSILINIIQVNKFSFKTFFENLKLQTNKTVYWGKQEFDRISNSFNFQFDEGDIEQLTLEWSNKIKGKLSLLDLAEALQLRLPLSENDVENIYKEKVKRTFQKLNGDQKDSSEQIEQEKQIITKRQDPFDDFNEADKIKIKDYINELSQYINDNHFFDPFETMTKNGYLSFNDIYEALKNGYSIFQSQDDIKLLARWFTANGPITLSELSRQLNYDMSHKKRNDERQKEQSEKTNQNINMTNYTRHEVNKQEAEQSLLSLLQIFKNNTNTIINVYFREGDHIIACDDFVKTTTNTCSTINYSQALNFFHFLDVNRSGYISKNDMLLVLGNAVGRPPKEQELEKIRESKDINTQITQVFQEVDKDGSNYIDTHEFDELLRAIGIVCSSRELQQYFQKFDANNDGKISFNEFKIVLEEKLINEIMVAEDLVDDLKRQFQRVDIYNLHVLSKPQLGYAFQSLGIFLSNQELNEIFNIIDVNKSGNINMDELLQFVNGNGTNLTGLATNVLLNLRSSRNMTIQDMKLMFSALPNTFHISFTRKKTKKRINLPSATIKPKLNIFDYYDGIRYNHKELHNQFRTNSLIERKFVPHNLNIEIKLDIATGIPIPKEQVPHDDVVSRHVYISFFDKEKKQLIGNSCRIPVKWNQNYEDRWNFKVKENFDNTIIVRHANYEQSKDQDIIICFEFCMSIRNSNQKVMSLQNKNKQKTQKEYDSFLVSTPDFEVSCCYGLITLSELLHSGSKSINLQGGSPAREMKIQKQDISTRRSGWRSVVKAVTKSITTTLKFDVAKSFSTQEMQDISTLPDQIIFPRKSLSLLKSFREYMVAKTIKQNLTINTKVHNLIEVKTFGRCMDCPDIFIPLSSYWKENIVPLTKDYQKELDTFAIFMQKLNLLIYHKGFRFNISDPAATFYSFPEIVQSRNELLQNTLMEAKQQCFQGSKNATNATQQNQQTYQQQGFQMLNCYESFNITDILSDDEDDDFDMLNSYLNFSKKGKVLIEEDY